MINMQRKRALSEPSAINETSVSQILLSRLRGHHRKDGKILRQKGRMSVTKQPLPETAERLHTCELITAMTACTRTRLAQDIAIGSSGINGGGAHEVPLLSEELSAIVSYWEKSYFLQGFGP